MNVSDCIVASATIHPPEDAEMVGAEVVDVQNMTVWEGSLLQH